MNDKDVIQLWTQNVKLETPLQKLYLKMLGFNEAEIDEILKKVDIKILTHLDIYVNY